jgi:uncharacterized protein (DUF1778 family)
LVLAIVFLIAKSCNFLLPNTIKEMNKVKRITFRITEAEYNKIKKKAQKSKLSISKYVSLSALDRDFVVIEDLKDLIHQLSKIGSNLNQLTMLAHQNRLKEINVRDTQAVLKDIWELLNKISK